MGLLVLFFCARVCVWVPLSACAQEARWDTAQILVATAGCAPHVFRSMAPPPPNAHSVYMYAHIYTHTHIYVLFVCMYVYPPLVVYSLCVSPCCVLCSSFSHSDRLWEQNVAVANHRKSEFTLPCSRNGQVRKIREYKGDSDTDVCAVSCFCCFLNDRIIERAATRVTVNCTIYLSLIWQVLCGFSFSLNGFGFQHVPGTFQRCAYLK